MRYRSRGVKCDHDIGLEVPLGLLYDGDGDLRETITQQHHGLDKPVLAKVRSNEKI